MHIESEVENPVGSTETTLMVRRRGKWADYHSLIKGRQTLLLYATGLCAFLLSLDTRATALQVIWLSVALLLSICGCTMLNMVVDRDIDAQMRRTQNRPLVTGALSVSRVTWIGTIMTLIGLGVAFRLDVWFGIIIATGLFFDLVIYSMWLKRRTPLSIVLGGISGGMPALAGRTLALGYVDLIGLLLALSILLWIPSHFITLTMKYRRDYEAAGVPVWPNIFGEPAAHRFIALANLLNGGVLLLCGKLLQITPATFILLLAGTIVMLSMALLGLVRPSEKLTWVLFKTASMYMLWSFLLITFGVLI